jgi:hypothetical protein
VPTVIDLDTRTIRDAVERLVTGSGRVREYAAGRVEVRLGERETYSYGTHFPLFRYVPRTYRAINAAGTDYVTVDRRSPALFVLNGDRWPGSRTRTPDHQRIARDAVAATGIQSIVLPFSALDGAGIVIDSIRPLDVRADMAFEETIERRTLDEVPVLRRTYSERVDRTASTIEGVPERERRTWRADETGNYSYGDILPIDGLYRWTKYVQRETLPDADGIYRWTETRHRLGDALFTAERVIRETRAALPFEESSRTARETLDVSPSGRAGDGCKDNNWNEHTAGPDAACIYCLQPLQASVTYRRRSRYLSSFDYNEPAPLYFLCEVPRAGVPTVDGALDSLAPRAVHAALLAGREVRRQGDIFLIDTPLDRATLVERGAVFGRLTQWSRGAKPRAGEVTYSAPDRDRDKAVAARELRYARKLWRDTFRTAVDAATAHENERTAPYSEPGYRARWTKRRADRDSAILVARRNLRRATLTTVRHNRYVSSGRMHNEGNLQYSRRLHLHAVISARRELERALSPATDSARNLHNRHARDNYRARYGTNAVAAWNRAQDTAQRRYRPETVQDHARAISNRESVRNHLAVYGTAHTATEVARIGSAVYVRGTVRHAVDLEPGRAGGPDHRPVTLTADHWYLAVRNTVPRQNRRRTRRKGNRTPSGS